MAAPAPARPRTAPERPVRTVAHLVDVYRDKARDDRHHDRRHPASAGDDRVRRALILELAAAGAPNIAAALAEEDHAHRVAVIADRDRAALSADHAHHPAGPPVPVHTPGPLEDRIVATARVNQLIADLPDAGRRPLDGAAATFTPRAAA